MLTDLLLSFEIEVYCATLLVFIESGFEFVKYFALEAFLQLWFDCVFGLNSNFLFHVAIF